MATVTVTLQHDEHSYPLIPHDNIIPVLALPFTTNNFSYSTIVNSLSLPLVMASLVAGMAARYQNFTAISLLD